jgi:hypothetical protein
MEPKLYILWGVCRMCHKGFERRYATQRGVKRAYTRAQNKRYSCCPNAGYTIGWAYDFAQEAILKQQRGITDVKP